MDPVWKLFGVRCGVSGGGVGLSLLSSEVRQRYWDAPKELLERLRRTLQCLLCRVMQSISGGRPRALARATVRGTRQGGALRGASRGAQAGGALRGVSQGQLQGKR